MPRRKRSAAEQIRAYRHDAGLSRPAFARMLGLTRRIIENTELGGTPALDNAKVLADELGTTVTELWPNRR